MNEHDIDTRTLWCGDCRAESGFIRYRCPGPCEAGKTRPISGKACGHHAPICFEPWCPRYRRPMVKWA